MTNEFITAAVQSLVDARNLNLKEIDLRVAQNIELENQISSLSKMANGDLPKLITDAPSVNAGIRQRLDTLMADHQARFYPDICLAVGAETTKEKNAVSAYLSTLIKKGLMRRPKYGLYQKAKRKSKSVLLKSSAEEMKQKVIAPVGKRGSGVDPNSMRQTILSSFPAIGNWKAAAILNLDSVWQKSNEVWPDLTLSRKVGRVGSHLANLEMSGKLKRVGEGLYTR